MKRLAILVLLLTAGSAVAENPDLGNAVLMIQPAFGLQKLETGSFWTDETYNNYGLSLGFNGGERSSFFLSAARSNIEKDVYTWALTLSVKFYIGGKGEDDDEGPSSHWR